MPMHSDRISPGRQAELALFGWSRENMREFRRNALRWFDGILLLLLLRCNWLSKDPSNLSPEETLDMLGQVDILINCLSWKLFAVLLWTNDSDADTSIIQAERYFMRCRMVETGEWFIIFADTEIHRAFNVVRWKCSYVLFVGHYRWWMCTGIKDAAIIGGWILWCLMQTNNVSHKAPFTQIPELHYFSHKKMKRVSALWSRTWVLQTWILITTSIFLDANVDLRVIEYYKITRRST